MSDDINDELTKATTDLAACTISEGKDRGRYIPIDTSNMEPELAAMVDAGYRLSSSTPHYIKAYVSSAVNRHSGVRGIGVWWGDEGKAATKNLSARVDSTTLDQGVVELLAVIRAIETCPHPEMPLEVDSGDDFVWTTVTVTVHKWQSKWFSQEMETDPNRKIISHFIALLREREHPVRFKYIRGHAGTHAAFDLALAAQKHNSGFPVEWKTADKYVNEPPLKAKHVSITRSIMI